MDWSALAIVCATFGGPIAAVQGQKFLERHQEKRKAKDYIFRTLMATRASRLSAQHVQALNGIELAFYGGGAKDKTVIEAWKAYHNHLFDKSYGTERVAEWTTRQIDLLIDLLHEMAVCLDYADFDKTHIKNSWYAPQAHTDMEEEALIIRQGFAKIFSGKASFPVASFAASTDEAERNVEIAGLTIDILKVVKQALGSRTDTTIQVSVHTTPPRPTQAQGDANPESGP